jgi:hypothetical protein
MNQLIIIIILLIILILVLIIKKINIIESFKNDDKTYLYPVKGLQSICSKEGLLPSFMPKACYIDGNMNSYANCKCEDERGNCKICYPTIQRDKSSARVVYDSTKGSSD